MDNKENEKNEKYKKIKKIENKKEKNENIIFNDVSIDSIHENKSNITKINNISKAVSKFKKSTSENSNKSNETCEKKDTIALASSSIKVAQNDIKLKKNINNKEKSFSKIASTLITSKKIIKEFKLIGMTKNRNYFSSLSKAKEKSFYHIINNMHFEKKKLDITLVEAEYKEMKRSRFYEELIVYILFLFLFFSLLSYLPIQNSYKQSDILSDLICTNNKDSICDFNINKRNRNDIYMFLQHIQENVCSISSISNNNNINSFNSFSKWIRIGNVKVRQIRVKKEKCNLFNIYTMDCYPSYSYEKEDKNPMILYLNTTNHTIYWNNKMENLRPWLHVSLFDQLIMKLFYNHYNGNILSYGTGGYLLDLCNNLNDDKNTLKLNDYLINIDLLRKNNYINDASRALSIEFILMNPINKIITIGSHVFTIENNGFLQYFPQSSNIGMVSTNHTNYECNNYYHFILFLMTCFFFLTYIRGEYTEINKMGIKEYICSDKWNIFELFQLYILGLVLYYIILYYYNNNKTMELIKTYILNNHINHQTNLFKDRNTNPSINMIPLLIIFQRMLDIISISSAINLLKIFKFLRMNSTLNLLWQVLGMAIKDLMGFLVIFNLIFLSYSFMGYHAFGLSIEEFNTLFNSYGTCFHMLAGSFNYDKLKIANPRIAPFFFGSFIILVLLILVNMFVAILSEYYEVAKSMLSTNTNNKLNILYNNNINNNGKGQQDIEYDVFTRIRSFSSSCSPRVVLPSNQKSLMIKKGSKIKLISTNVLDKEIIRQKAKILFRGAVWRVVALLRFGVQFDRKLLNINKKKKKKVLDTTKDMYPSKSKYDDNINIPLSDDFDHKTIKTMLPVGINITLEGDSLLSSDIISLKVIKHSNVAIECMVLDYSIPEAFSINRCKQYYIDIKNKLYKSVFQNMFILNQNKQIDHSILQENNKSSNKINENEIKSNKDNDSFMELLGNERLQIPLQFFILYVSKSILKSLKKMILRATKIYEKNDYLLFDQSKFINDYHLSLLLLNAKKEGRTSLRFDELYRLLDLFIRKKKLRYSNSTISSPKSNILLKTDNISTTLLDNNLDMITQSDIHLATGCIMYRFRKSLIEMPSREKEGYNYVPCPINTKSIELGHLSYLSEILAENCHDIWAIERIKNGWTYGKERDDILRKHPNLIGFINLPQDEKSFDYRTSMETLKTIISLRFSITKRKNQNPHQNQTQNQNLSLAAHSKSLNIKQNSNINNDTNSDYNNVINESNDNNTNHYHLNQRNSIKKSLSNAVSNVTDTSGMYYVEINENGDRYYPTPVDASMIELPNHLLVLVDLLAENAHEVWSKGRMDDGWIYGTVRDDKKKKHPCLVPFVFLTDQEKEYDINTAMGTLKMLIALGFTIEDKRT